MVVFPGQDHTLDGIAHSGRKRRGRTEPDHAAQVERGARAAYRGEGRKELTARAKAAENKRERSLAAYHHYEVASAGVQIAIVLASAAIITGMTVPVWIAGGPGMLRVGFF